MTRPAALIFDVDGTLAETEECHRQAFNATFAAFKLDWRWPPELYRELLQVAGGKERLAHFIATHRPPGGAAMLDRIAELHAAKTGRYAAMIDAGAAPLRPGVARLLTEAAEAGVILAIATTTSPANVEALLRAALGSEAPAGFAVVGAGDVVAAKKPAPDIYRHVLSLLALPPEACVAFEDSAIGLTAARAAGLPVVVTPSRYTAGEDFAGALAVLDDLGEPYRPYRWLAGAGRGDSHVTVDILRRWTEPAF